MARRPRHGSSASGALSTPTPMATLGVDRLSVIAGSPQSVIEPVSQQRLLTFHLRQSPAMSMISRSMASNPIAALNITRKKTS